MTDLVHRLQAALHSARKGQDKDRLLLLGTVLSAVRTQQLDVARPLRDDEVRAVLLRGIKQRREAAEQFGAAGRADLAARERAQVVMIEEFLPAPAGEAEIRDAVRGAIAAGATTLGAVMAAVMSRFAGRAEGREINRIARAELPSG